MTLPVNIAQAVQQSQEWLQELKINAALSDEAEAFAVMRAVLHQLCDRLTSDEASRLAARLPLVFQGIFCEGTLLTAKSTDPDGTHRSFLAGVDRRLEPRRLAAESVAPAVLRLLDRRAAATNISTVIVELTRSADLCGAEKRGEHLH